MKLYMKFIWFIIVLMKLFMQYEINYRSLIHTLASDVKCLRDLPSNARRYFIKAKARARYKTDPEKKASVRDSYTADPEKKKASVRSLVPRP